MEALEDRVLRAGKHQRFTRAIEGYRAGKIDANTLYDELVACGATAEEADEFVQLESGD